MTDADDPRDVDDLAAANYDRLRNLARHVLGNRRGDAVLQPTALVHDVYLELAAGERSAWRSQSHFYAIASRAMRHALVDHLRSDGRAKRGGDRQRVTTTDLEDEREAVDLDVLAMHDALERYARLDPRAARIVEMRFFAGMSGDAIAAELGISRQTVVRDLTAARAWLARALADRDA